MIRFYNGRVLTLADDLSITNDEVWVDGNKITYIAPKKEGKFDREIDLNGNLLMPCWRGCLRRKT